MTNSDIRPLALKFHMAHGTACRSRALQLERNMTVQCLKPSLSRDCWKEGCSQQQKKKIVLARRFPDILPRDVSNLCHRSGRGFEARLLPSSHRMLPRRRECQAHAPLFEWTKFLRFQTRSLVPLSSTPSSSSPSSSSSVCLFFRGGLGVGEKPTRGELVRSTHRVPSPFISSQRFPFETFLMRCGKYGVGSSLWPFPPRCVSSVCVEGSRSEHPR